MSAGHIAVIDVGKTNKKVIVFDQALHIVDSSFAEFSESVEDGIHLENIAGMTAWFKKTLAGFAAKYRIEAISVTTHGATVLCLDAAGQLAVPPVAYTTEADEGFRQEFYRVFGAREQLQQTTGTAEVGSLINTGKLIYFMQKRYPDRFAGVRTILNFPQYIGYLLTGKTGAEPTFMGCHTYLYDFAGRGYSDVARQLGIIDKLPGSIRNPWDVLGTVSPAIAAQCGLPDDCIVTLGIHDSNSSLLPYLVKGFTNFALNSTGTWCVLMHPTDSVSFRSEELGKLVFFNCDAFFNPVKTSIFMGGLEFDTYMKLLHGRTGRSDYPSFDFERYQRIIHDRALFIIPSVQKGTGLFPDSRPRVWEDGVQYDLEEIRTGARVPPSFHDLERAHAALNLSIVLQTRIALDMAGYRGGGDVFIEGGFRKNSGYTTMLASLCPDSTVSCTSLQEATAFGAAILAKTALTRGIPADTRDLFDIDMRKALPHAFTGLEQYEQRFRELVADG